jgi:hypothetical protein
MEKTNNKVKIWENISPNFEMVVGQRQGAHIQTFARLPATQVFQIHHSQSAFLVILCT